MSGDAPFLPSSSPTPTSGEPTLPPSGTPASPTPGTPDPAVPFLPGQAPAPAQPPAPPTPAPPTPAPPAPPSQTTGSAPIPPPPGRTPPGPRPDDERRDSSDEPRSKKDKKAKKAKRDDRAKKKGRGATPDSTGSHTISVAEMRAELLRQKRKRTVLARTLGVMFLAAVITGGYLSYREIADQGGDDPVDEVTAATAPSAVTTPAASTPSTLAPGAVAVPSTAAAGSQQPLVNATTGSAVLVSELFTPVVLERTDTLDVVDGFERYVIRYAELAGADSAAAQVFVGLLDGLPPAATSDGRLGYAPLALPGDIAVALRRDGDQVLEIVVVSADPPLSVAAP